MDYKKTPKQVAELGIAMAQRGLRYGDDMKSSSALCWKDAVELLKEAIRRIESEVEK
jgi:hypothetical protein